MNPLKPLVFPFHTAYQLSDGGRAGRKAPWWDPPGTPPPPPRYLPANSQWR